MLCLEILTLLRDVFAKCQGFSSGGWELNSDVSSFYWFITLKSSGFTSTHVIFLVMTQCVVCRIN